MSSYCKFLVPNSRVNWKNSFTFIDSSLPQIAKSMYNSASCLHLFQLSAKFIASKSRGAGGFSWVIISSLLPPGSPSSADPSADPSADSYWVRTNTSDIMFQQATATCHKNNITVYFESHSSLYTHSNEASVHPSTEATINNNEKAVPAVQNLIDSWNNTFAEKHFNS